MSKVVSAISLAPASLWMSGASPMASGRRRKRPVFTSGCCDNMRLRLSRIRTRCRERIRALFVRTERSEQTYVCCYRVNSEFRQLQLYPALRLQGDGGPRRYLVIGGASNAEALEDSGKDECAFHGGKGVPDADTRAAAERKIGEFGKGAERAVQPATRTEGRRFGEMA